MTRNVGVASMTVVLAATLIGVTSSASARAANVIDQKCWPDKVGDVTYAYGKAPYMPDISGVCVEASPETVEFRVSFTSRPPKPVEATLAINTDLDLRTRAGGVGGVDQLIQNYDGRKVITGPIVKLRTVHVDEVGHDIIFRVSRCELGAPRGFTFYVSAGYFSPKASALSDALPDRPRVSTLRYMYPASFPACG